jgi:hypothetical protein
MFCPPDGLDNAFDSYLDTLPVTLSNRSAYDIRDRNIIKLGNHLRRTSQIKYGSLCQSK